METNLNNAAGQIGKEARELAENILDAVRDSLIVLNADLRVISANKSFFSVFKVSQEETLNRYIYDLGNNQWDIPALRRLLEDILPDNSEFDNYKIEHEFLNIGKRVMLLNARRIPRPPAKPKIILLAIEDITDREKIEEIKQKAENLEEMNKIMTGRELKIIELKKEIAGLREKYEAKAPLNQN